MIIGNGLLARAFDAPMLARARAIVYASGVSNSNESRPEPFLRERNMLESALAAAHDERFVYFSTCSVTDEDRLHTHYVQHKLAMEALVRARPRHLILRLPQVVGVTGNPHTLTNFLANSIRSGSEFQVWRGAVRCLIDVEHVAMATYRILGSDQSLDITADLAPPWTITMPEMVGLMEQALGLRANYSVLDRGGGNAPDSTLLCRLADSSGIDLSPGYAERLIVRYYGQPALSQSQGQR